MSMLAAAQCRITQAFVRLGRRLHPAGKQTLETGAGALFSVGQLLRDRRLRKPMAVLGPEPETVKNRLLRVLEESDISFVVWDKLSQPPTAEDAELMSLTWQGEQCDCFVVLGDGPVIDAAKAAAARCVRRSRTIMDMVGRRRVRRKLPPVVAIPTVAGSGAESLAAVSITDKRGTRFVMEDEVLTPAVAVLDPELLADAPRSKVAEAGLDGLCRAIEAYLAASGGDQKTRTMAAQAAGLFLEELEPCWNKGGAVKDREELLSASRMAGAAASAAGCGYVRAMCRAAQSVCGVDFATACGALLPAVLERYGSHAVRPLAELASAADIAPGGPQSQRAAALIGRIRDMVFRMGLPDALEDVTAGEAADIADMAVGLANPRWISPVVWTAEQCAEVLKGACAPRERRQP